MTHDSASLESARVAFGNHSWKEAFALFVQSKDELRAADLESLAECAWWTAELDTCIDARERAFELYRNEGNNKRAAMTAIALAKDHFARNQGSIGTAWFRRAEHLLRDEKPCLELGHLERMRSVMALEGEGDFQTALERAEAAIAIAGRVTDRDLLAISLHDKGRALIGLRRIDEGSALMDEANLAAVSGELSPFWTAAVFCNTITACKEMADYTRAGDWTEAAKRWCDRQAIAGFPGMCRVYRASILRLHGAWNEALDEVQRAAEETATFNVSYAAAAFNELGEIRLEMGDLDGAEEAFARASELGRDPQPGMALIQLARGNSSGAWMSLERALDEQDGDLHRAPLLPAAVEVAVVVEDLEAARTYAEELQKTAEVYRTLALRSAAITAEGRVRLASGDAEGAAKILRRAAQLWRESDVPYEVGRTRELLGRALEECGDEEGARLEFSAANSVLERLGSSVRAEAAPESKTAPAPNAPPSTSVQKPNALLKREGEYWSITYANDSFLLKDSKGLHHLARLLVEPGREQHVLDLSGTSEGGTRGRASTSEDVNPTRAAEDSGPVLDPEAKAAYRARLEELREELQEAEEWADQGRISKAREEIEFIAAELAAAVGLGGRDRKAASTAEKARLNVSRSIRSTIDRIAEYSPALGAHLAATVKTGTFCAYVPDPRNPIRWET